MQYPVCQRLFWRGFRFLSSLYSDPRFAARGFGCTREKPLVPRVTVQWELSPNTLSARGFFSLSNHADGLGVAPYPSPPPPSPGRKGLRDTNLVPRAFPLKNGWGKALGARLARYLFLELSDWYQIFSGAPNDGFLLNSLKTLFKAIQRTFRSIEMHSKRRYKICICSVILGQLESF